MYHHMEIFKNVDVIVTPTTGYEKLSLFNIRYDMEQRTKYMYFLLFSKGLVYF